MMNIRNIFDYAKRDKRILVSAILLLLGFALLVLGSFGGRENNEETSSEEEKILALCKSVDGVGECYVTVSYDGECVASIIVLCEGGDSISVKKRLSDILVTLYDIGYNRVMIDRLC